MAHTQTAHELANEFTPRLSKLVRLLARETAGTGMSRTSLSVLATLRDAGTARITELAETEHVAQPSMTTLVWKSRDSCNARRTRTTDAPSPSC